MTLGGAKRRSRRTELGTRARDVAIVDIETGKDTNLWPQLCDATHSLLVFQDERRPIALDGVAEAAGAHLQILPIDDRCDPTGKVRTRYRLDGPGWVLVRPDQIIAARGVGGDLGALQAYASQVLEPART